MIPGMPFSHLEPQGGPEAGEAGLKRLLCTLAFTLVELLVVIAILGTLAGIGITNYRRMIDKAKTTRAIADIKNLQTAIEDFWSDTGSLPSTLDDLATELPVDPWGNPYQYANFDLIPPGKKRKDHFMVPVNNSYDLYSMGPDGDSKPPFTAGPSRDDIVRANDGGYIGPVSGY
jgi:general secretion pathway protein G